MITDINRTKINITAHIHKARMRGRTTETVQPYFEDPETLLVLLFVLEQKHEMALLFWWVLPAQLMPHLVLEHIMRLYNHIHFEMIPSLNFTSPQGVVKDAHYACPGVCPHHQMDGEKGSIFYRDNSRNETSSYKICKVKINCYTISDRKVSQT